MMDPLPWQAVNSEPAQRVAGLLGLEKAREARKFACVSCSSSDALHSFPNGGFHCFSCGRSWSNVDAAALALRIEPGDACRLIAEQLGVSPPRRWDKHRKAGGAAGTPKANAPSTEAMPDSRTAIQKAEVYGEVLEILSLGKGGVAALGPVACRFLEGRRLDAEQAGNYGFRSIETPRVWSALDHSLLGRFSAEHLVASGLYAKEGSRLRLQYPGDWNPRVPALVLPYWSHGEVAGLRFRRLDTNGTGRKYRSIRGVQPAEPFNAEVLEDAAGQELHVCEGELDAFTVLSEPYCCLAVGLPGASPGRVLTRGLAEALGPAERVVCWFDPDGAGTKGYSTLCRALQAIHGGTWLRNRVVRAVMPLDGDVNDLHRHSSILI